MTTLEAYNAFLRGDESAAEVLISCYGDMLFHFAMRYLKNEALAEDAVEDAFVAFLLARKRFSAEGQLRTYLYRAVRSRAIDRLRTASREISLCEVEEVLSETEEASGDPAQLAVYAERNAVLRRCMEEIAPQYKEALVLFYFEELSFDEVCRVTGKSRRQVYNCLTRARAAMKELLIREGISDENF